MKSKNSILVSLAVWILLAGCSSRTDEYRKRVIPLANQALENMPIADSAKIDYETYKQIHVGSCELSNSLAKASTDRRDLKPWGTQECIDLMEQTRPNIDLVKKRPPMPKKKMAIKCGPPIPDDLHLGELARALTEKQGQGIFPAVVKSEKNGECGTFINYGKILEHHDTYDTYDTYEVFVSINVDEDRKQELTIEIHGDGGSNGNKELARKVFLAIISVTLPSSTENWSQVLDKEIFSIPRTNDDRIQLKGAIGKYFKNAAVNTIASNRNIFVHLVDGP